MAVPRSGSMVAAHFRKLGGSLGQNAALTRALVKAGAFAPKLPLGESYAQGSHFNVFSELCFFQLWKGAPSSESVFVPSQQNPTD